MSNVSMIDGHIDEPAEKFKKNFGDLLNLCRRQKLEIEFLVQKTDSLRDRINELESEVERLKEFEYAYNYLFK